MLYVVHIVLSRHSLPINRGFLFIGCIQIFTTRNQRYPDAQKDGGKDEVGNQHLPRRHEEGVKIGPLSNRKNKYF